MNVNEIPVRDRAYLGICINHKSLSFDDICDMVRSGDLGEYGRDEVWDALSTPLEWWGEETDDEPRDDLRDVLLGLMAHFETKFSWPIDERYSSPGDTDFLDLSEPDTEQVETDNEWQWPVKIVETDQGDDLQVLFRGEPWDRNESIVELGRQYGTKALRNSLGQSERLDERIQHALGVIEGSAC